MARSGDLDVPVRSDVHERVTDEVRQDLLQACAIDREMDIRGVTELQPRIILRADESLQFFAQIDGFEVKGELAGLRKGKRLQVFDEALQQQDVAVDRVDHTRIRCVQPVLNRFDARAQVREPRP
jgi:hypothetical protein